MEAIIPSDNAFTEIPILEERRKLITSQSEKSEELNCTCCKNDDPFNCSDEMFVECGWLHQKKQFLVYLGPSLWAVPGFVHVVLVYMNVLEENKAFDPLFCGMATAGAIHSIGGLFWNCLKRFRRPDMLSDFHLKEKNVERCVNGAGIPIHLVTLALNAGSLVLNLKKPY